eukprot:COSAG02_NODE_40539_length_404_cov_0.921311_2_plen_23_part_01
MGMVLTDEVWTLKNFVVVAIVVA